MTTSIKDRLSYHPDPLATASGSGHTGRSGRRVDNRRLAIESRLALDGRRMLDFGCSGGYFGFAWASRLANYTGIDGDAAVIARNIAAAEKLGLSNLSFHQGNLTPSLVNALPEADLGIFLSVFHHILASSSAYAWNSNNTFEPFELLRAIRGKVKTLIFETGYPDERLDWCNKLPPMEPTPRRWVDQQLKKAGFSRVTCVPSTDVHGMRGRVRSLIGRSLGLATHPQRLTSRVLQRVVHFDPRDDRDIYIAE